ncbi:GrpB family protein [Streptomyces sp. SID13031]|uniref:GrpB family protein n=1 Tax=Streptomyces sp. SID13031 TaxID=2706046 RepID=UPI0013C70423|nr:GrpB family protein [Streptomyces sp. SID13031]
MIPPAEVVPYDDRWPAWFDELRASLDRLLAGLPAEIEHVGSTAVPGLAAKPIIDVDVVVPTAEQVPTAVAALAAGGYEHEGDLGIAGREAFRMPVDAVRYHHLYVVVAGNKAHRDHLVLRDRLRTDPEALARYAELKRELAPLLRVDRSAYVDGKGALIEELLS